METSIFFCLKCLSPGCIKSECSDKNIDVFGNICEEEINYSETECSFCGGHDIIEIFIRCSDSAIEVQMFTTKDSKLILIDNNEKEKYKRFFTYIKNIKDNEMLVVLKTINLLYNHLEQYLNENIDIDNVVSVIDLFCSDSNNLNKVINFLKENKDIYIFKKILLSLISR